MPRPAPPIARGSARSLALTTTLTTVGSSLRELYTSRVLIQHLMYCMPSLADLDRHQLEIQWLSDMLRCFPAKLYDMSLTASSALYPVAIALIYPFAASGDSFGYAHSFSMTPTICALPTIPDCAATSTLSEGMSTNVRLRPPPCV